MVAVEFKYVDNKVFFSLRLNMAVVHFNISN